MILYKWKNVEHKLKWSYIPDRPYWILMIGGSGWGVTNALINQINNQSDIDKMYLYVRDAYEAKFQYLTLKRLGGGVNLTPLWFF